MRAQKIEDIPSDDRPRERLLHRGAGSLSDAELLAVLLRTGTRGQSALDMAHELLAERGGLAGLLGAELETVRRHGLGRAKAATVMAAVELGRRLARRDLPVQQLLDRPDAVARYLFLRYAPRHQEVMGALYLDIRNRLLSEQEIFRGTLTRAVVEPRQILREALQRRAVGMVLFHTHPDGDPSPSLQDLDFTRRMREAGELIGVRLIDHLIVGAAGSWVSLGRQGAG
ncbi:MAG: DNA repair protein RadC [Acidobacteriota bacterium]